MTISFNYKDSFDTAKSTANKSMDFDPSAINLLFLVVKVIILKNSRIDY